MEKIYVEKERVLPVRDEVDVLVVGGGPAGVMAAVAARITGAEKVLLIERYGFLGGMLTAGAVLNMRTFNDHAGNLVIAGLPLQFAEELRKRGGAIYQPEKHECVRHDPEITKHTAQAFCMRQGVKLLLHTFVAGAVMEGNTVRGVIIESKSGREAILAKVVVDATGDADVAAFAGAAYEMCDDVRELQPMTTTFVMGNVCPDTWPEVLTEAALEKAGELYEKGLYPIRRKGLAIFPMLRRGEAYANITRAQGNAACVEDLTKAEILCREQIMQVIDFLRAHIPGYENCHLLYTAPQVGIRETRRITGEYVLTREDVLRGREFPDAVARGSYMIDVHHNDDTTEHTRLKPGTSYAIPFGCLLPVSVDGLLTAGRCISSTHDANGSCRVMVICMATGHAAGTAAGLAAAGNRTPRRVNVEELQAALRKQGAIL